MAEGGSGIWTPPGGSADPRWGQRRDEQDHPPADDVAGSVIPDELVEQIKRLKVSDVLVSMLPTLAQLGYAKLEPTSRDLEEARLAIESLRALVDVLAGSTDDEALRDFRQVIANLQLAYAEAVSSGT